MHQINDNENQRRAVKQTKSYELTKRRRRRFHWLELLTIAFGIITVTSIIGIAVFVVFDEETFFTPNQHQSPVIVNIERYDYDCFEYDYDNTNRYIALTENYTESESVDEGRPNDAEVRSMIENDDNNVEQGISGDSSGEVYFLASEIELPMRRFIVAIDPGHQGRGNYSREPNGPGSTVYKAKVASGTRGISSGVPEFQLVLDVSLLLRDELVERGFDVFMVRETNDVDISNRERAIMASEANADIFVRVHANGSSNSNAHGILTISHSKNNPYIPELYELSRSLSDHILASMIESTGARNLGVLEMDNMTGSNWSTVPVTIVEMGFMTNPREDELMQTLEYQQKLVTGMANGIEAYFYKHFNE